MLDESISHIGECAMKIAIQSIIVLFIFSVVTPFVSAQAEDISAISIVADADKAGFFSGLWHGGFVGLRAIASVFLDIEVFASHNTGVGYLSGFTLGLLFFAGIGIPKS